MSADLLPSSALVEERALSISLAPSEEIVPEILLTLSRPFEVPSAFLPHLAWGAHVDLWRAEYPEDIKRALVAGSAAWHRLKGTRRGILDLLALLGYDVEILEYASAREIYRAAGILKVDGTWEVGGETPKALRSVKRLEGIPELRSWAEFAVLVDLSDASRRGWTHEMRLAVDEMKPARSWPVWVFRLLLNLRVEATLSSGLLMEKAAAYDYPWDNLKVNGSWRIGRDAANPSLSGQKLNGSWRIGEAVGVQPGPEIRQRVIRFSMTLGKRGVTSPAPFPARLSEQEVWPLRLSGWKVDAANGILVQGRSEIASNAAVQASPAAFATHVAAFLLDYPASPRRIVEAKLSGRRLDGSWRVGGSPVGARLDGWGMKNGGLSASGRVSMLLNGCAPVGARRIGIEVPKIGVGWSRRLDGMWRLGAKLRLDGSWGVGDGGRYLTAPKTGVVHRKIDGTWSVGGRPLSLNGMWKVGEEGTRMEVGGI